MAKIKAYGTDQSRWQGISGKNGYSRDDFAIIQIGGYSPTAGIYNQTTYHTQLKAMSNLKLHTYIWFEVGGNANKAKLVLDYFLPRIKTPKGSIVAIDYEQGASGNVTNNTNTILYSMDRIAKAGYTPMLYTGKSYMYAHVNVARFLSKYPRSLWIASYMDYKIRAEPNFNYFPSMDGIALWQFTSTYKSGGLDGNVDLTGITENGYVKDISKNIKLGNTSTKVDSKKYLTKIKIAKTKKDIYLYNSTRFKKVNRVMMFKKGTYFKIVKIVPVGKTTRLLTQSGYYITGNKSFIKAYR